MKKVLLWPSYVPLNTNKKINKHKGLGYLGRKNNKDKNRLKNMGKKFCSRNDFIRTIKG
jgi:hypothetical protein